MFTRLNKINNISSNHNSDGNQNKNCGGKRATYEGRITESDRFIKSAQSQKDSKTSQKSNFNETDVL